MRSLAHGFTIIEIIVVIALLAIFTLTATSVDFSRLSVRQEQEIFTNQVIGTIQSLKNFAFQWKWVGLSLETPSEWTLRISENGNGEIRSSYTTSTASNIAYPSLSIDERDNYSISGIICKSFDGSLPDETPTSDTVTLSFISDRIILSGCPSPRYTILEFTTSHGEYSDIVQIHTVSTVIQKL